MASSSSHHLLFLVSSLVLLFSTSLSKTTSFRPKALVLPVTKDTSTKHPQYIVQLRQRTPLVPLKLALDLGGDFLWLDCDTNYVSSSYCPARCRSAPCNLARSMACGECSGGPKPGCNINTCSVIPYNPFITTSSMGELASDVVSLLSTDGFNPGRAVSAPKVLFACGGGSLQGGLARGVVGFAGLGRKKIGLPSQLAAAFSFPRKFAICLTSSSAKGVVFIGNEPYALLPNHVVSKNLIYTPLIFNPVSTAGSFFQGEASSDYFIGVKSIRVNGKVVRGINSTLLSIAKDGTGGTKISTVAPYTLMHTSIYKAVLAAFVGSTGTRVKAIAPFGACYAASSLGSTRVGPGVPQIDLVLKNKTVWSIFGSNSMVLVSDGVYCLGFVDGGLSPQTSIVIGAHQIEDNLLQFDLGYSRLGFTSSLLFRQTTCANFNFTSVA